MSPKFFEPVDGSLGWTETREEKTRLGKGSNSQGNDVMQDELVKIQEE